MRIISGNRCSQCCYCMDDEDGYGMCCKDTIYKNISINQTACKYFCGDDESLNYYSNTTTEDNYE